MAAQRDISLSIPRIIFSVAGPPNRNSDFASPAFISDNFYKKVSPTDLRRQLETVTSMNKSVTIWFLTEEYGCKSWNHRSQVGRDP